MIKHKIFKEIGTMVAVLLLITAATYCTCCWLTGNDMFSSRFLSKEETDNQVDMGAVGNKITVDGTVAYVAEDTADPNYDSEYRTQTMSGLTQPYDEDLNETDAWIYENSPHRFDDNRDPATDNHTSQVPADELLQIEEMLNTREANGFVARNFYDNIGNIDLELVFREYHYGEAHAEEIDDEYMFVYGAEELYSPISAVSSTEIKEVYKKYTGKDIYDVEIRHRLPHYKYLPKYDVYCDMHGDSSYLSVKCVSGTKESDNTYVITIDYGYRSYEEGELSILTLEKHGDSYVFVSNILIDTD